MESLHSNPGRGAKGYHSVASYMGHWYHLFCSVQPNGELICAAR
jgi:hypothetical protein